MKKEKIILIGGGGHCKSCIDVIEQEARFEIEGILDVPEKIGQNVLNYNIIGIDDDIKKLSKSVQNFLITVGQIRSAEKRVSLFLKLLNIDIILPTIRSPLSYISKHAKIGKGTIIMHYAMINANASIGDNCIINSKSLVEHDVEIGDHCHISTGAIVNGGVRVGARTFYGSSAVSKENITIPENSVIKANSIIK